MTRTLLLLSIGTLCFVQDQTSPTVIQNVDATGQQPVAQESEDQRLVREMQEFRTQLLAVYGANHPLVEQVDRQILVKSARTAVSLEGMVRSPFVQLELANVPGTETDLGNVVPTDSLLWMRDGAPAPLPPQLPMVGHEWQPARSFETTTRAIVRAAGTPAYDKKLNELRMEWEKTEDATRRAEISDELRATIGQQFDTDLAQRRQQVAAFEEKLAELKSQVEKREAMRDEFVQVLSRHTEMTWEGVSLPTNRRATVIATPDPKPQDK